MTKKLFTLLLAVAASVGTMFASTKIGDLYYNLDATNQTAEVTSQNGSNPYWSTTITTANIPTSVTYNSVTYSVTSIGYAAFYECSSLTSVTIPNSVTRIGWYAFFGCSSLTSVTIPNSVTGIGAYAFNKCSSLTSINVASDNSNYCSVDGVLFNKDKTTLIQYPGGKQGAYTIPDGIESIEGEAFYKCTGLTSVTIPNSVTSIRFEAFYGCSGLTSVTIPNSVTSIESSTFSGCSGLTSITIPNSVTSIGGGAFQSCTGLTSVTIPNGVTSIGDYAFALCYGLTSIEIPNSVTSIEGSTFNGCSGLTSVTIPNSVTSIGGGAFHSCTGLTSVTIPNSVTSIGNSAFSGCSGLTSVTIPNSVTSIGDEAFYYCTGLTSITCEATTPPTLKSRVFYGVDHSIPLYVPSQSIDLYKSADQWKYFTNILPKDAYWVEFIDWDGTKIQSGWVKENTAAIPPLDPVREGYTFVGWDKPLNNITEDLIVTAQYSINHYPVVLLDHDGKLLSKQSVAYNRAAEVPEIPVREGYTFAGWTTDIEHIIDTTYAIAVYDKIGGTVIYKAEDGEIIGSENVDLHLPAAPSIDGKSFAGWLTEEADAENGIVLRATYTSDNPTTHDDVTVTPTSHSADVSFPFITGALTYELVIRDQSGNVVCKIMFNSAGQLLGIAFAPSRNRAQQQATQSTGFNFTVEGLNASTTYEYEFVAYDETDNVIEALMGSFTTSSDVATDVQNAPTSNSVQSIIQGGNVYILRGEKVWTVTGQEVK